MTEKKENVEEEDVAKSLLKRMRGWVAWIKSAYIDCTEVNIFCLCGHFNK